MKHTRHSTAIIMAITLVAFALVSMIFITLVEFGAIKFPATHHYHCLGTGIKFYNNVEPHREC